MKIAVFGGTGFLGYDFVRYVLKSGNIIPVVYSSSPKSMVNVARHDLDIRQYSVSIPEDMVLDPDVEYIVNFSHPFLVREKISAKKQIERFANLVRRQKEQNPALRLIHVSSMSVYEPFDKDHRFGEDLKLDPSINDKYASEKVYAESILRELPDANDWQLHLRPTVVYGPYCRVWTDRIMEAFDSGNVAFSDLSGKIQPVYGEDISKFIYDRINDFKPGVYNFPGPEEMTWKDYIETYRLIIGKGCLERIELNNTKQSTKFEGVEFYSSNFRELMHVIRREPSFDRIAVRLAQRLPDRVVQMIKDILLGKENQKSKNQCVKEFKGNLLFSTPFYGEDRLVSDQKLRKDFPNSKYHKLSEVNDIMREYYLYRFTDKVFN